jgi:desulfoferrodoxin (superoxide reductase-like protein)
MANSNDSSRYNFETNTIPIELVPRRMFLRGAGVLGLSFVVPACGAAKQEAVAPSTPEPTASPGVTRNDAWEEKASALENATVGTDVTGLYTAKNTKNQAGKEGKHVPKFALAGEKIQVSTTHPTEAPSEAKPQGHFISHHYLRDTSTNLIFAWKEYNLSAGETAATEFDLPAGVTSFTAYQVCNLHGTWASEPLGA